MTISKRALVLAGIAGAFALVTAGTARADGNIYTGGKTGSYFTVFGPLLKDVLGKQFFRYELVESAGSAENINQVATSPTSLALVQTDILSAELAAKPDLASKVVVVRNDVANECAFAVAAAGNTALTNWGDIESFGRRLKLVTGPVGSGSAATLAFLKSLSDTLKDAPVTNAASVDAAIDEVAKGKADVAFFVQFPDTSNPRFKQVNDAKLTYIPVINRAILRQTAKDAPAYVATEVKVTAPGFASLRGGSKITTVCTPIAYLAGNPEVLPAGNQQADMKELIQKLRAVDVAALRPKENWFKQAVENTVHATGAGLESMLKSAEDAAKAIHK